MKVNFHSLFNGQGFCMNFSLMKIINLILFFCAFQAISQDTFLLVRQSTFENDTLTRLNSIEYNSKKLPIYSISVNYKRKDTTEIFTEYNSDNKISQYVQSGPYFRDRWDTTFYSYENDLTIITQSGRNYERIRKTDRLGRSLSSSSKSFNDTGRLIIHNVDTTFYDDLNYVQTSKSYRKIDIPKPKFNPSKETHRMYLDGHVVDVELPSRIDFTEIDKPKMNNNKFELKAVTKVIRNKAGQALEIIKRNDTTGRYEYDSSGRMIYLEVKNSQKGDTTFMSYSYEIIGDTLIKTDWKMQSREDAKPIKGTVYKESIAKVDGNTLWRYVFVDGLLIAESNRAYNAENQLTRIVIRREKEVEWSEIKYVYEYKKF